MGSQADAQRAAAVPLQQVLNKVAAERRRRRGAAQAGVEGHGEGEGEGRVEGPAGRRRVRSRALRKSRADAEERRNLHAVCDLCGRVADEFSLP